MKLLDMVCPCSQRTKQKRIDINLRRKIVGLVPRGFFYPWIIKQERACRIYNF